MAKLAHSLLTVFAVTLIAGCGGGGGRSSAGPEIPAGPVAPQTSTVALNGNPDVEVFPSDLSIQATGTSRLTGQAVTVTKSTDQAVRDRFAGNSYEHNATQLGTANYKVGVPCSLAIRG
jgi:hypothetical protein